MEKLDSDRPVKARLYGKALSGTDRPTAHAGDGVTVYVPPGLQADYIVAFTGTGAYTGELFTHMSSSDTPTTVVFDNVRVLAGRPPNQL